MWPIRLPCAGSKFTKIRQHEIPSVWGFQEVIRGTVPTIITRGTVPGNMVDYPRKITIITRGTVPERLARDYEGTVPDF